MARSLLFVEFGSRPSREVRRGFPNEGFEVNSASGVAHAQRMMAMRNYSGCVLFAAAGRRLRSCVDALARCENESTIPIVCVADLREDEEADVLDRGASLCLLSTTPFAQMLSQLRALFDVVEGFPPHYRICDLGIDPVTRRASRGGRPLALRPREFDLLLYLAERAERTVSSDELHREFWPRQRFSSCRIAVHIHNLRRAIGVARQAPLLHTVRGGGYTLSATYPARMSTTH